MPPTAPAAPVTRIGLSCLCFVVERLAAQIITVQLDQIKCKHERTAAIAPSPDQLEHRYAVIPARDCLAIEDARAGAQARQGFDDLREALSEVVAWAAVQLDALVLLARYDPDAIVFYLMPPFVSRGGARGFGWEGRGR